MAKDINKIKVDRLKGVKDFDFDTPPTYDIYDKQEAKRVYQKFLNAKLKEENKNAD